MTPLFCNNAEIVTYKVSPMGDMVVIKFYYSEPKMPNYSPAMPMPEHMSVVSVIIPRASAKEMVKRMTYFLAKQDEHSISLVCGNCELYMDDACPMKLKAKIDPKKDGCSKFKVRSENNAKL